ncbi:LPS biosynthesis protein [Clostridium felsineum]|uniref:acyltransferase n=1 Tax=Clostridium felsineum TaxID=36839 RepID=UPI00214DEF53|nr:LPS biosynthesis protein [Clostridium felsineum]MCR3759845.1 LPS biosynthesis protein [Clostridium felsineum]
MNFKSIGKNVIIYGKTKITFPENVEIGNNVIIDDFVFINSKKSIKIGNNVHIASFVSITGNENFIMEDFTSLATGTKIITSTDDYANSYLTNPTVPDEFKNVYSAPIILKKFSAVGANTVILPGATLSEGTYIGANSLIKCNAITEPFSLYVGSPIKKIKDLNSEKIFNLEKKYLKEYR